MKTLTTLKVAARKHGATLWTGSLWYGRILIDAPAGKVWAASSTHALCVDWEAKPESKTGSPIWPEEKQAALTDAIERMSLGLTECDDPDCDLCNDDIFGDAEAVID